MTAKRIERPERRAERRRKLAEVNLLAEHRVKAPASRRSCALPILGGLGLIAVGVATAATWLHP